MASVRHARSSRFGWAKLAALLVPLLLVLSACGGDDSGGSSAGGGGEAPAKITILLPFQRSIAFWPVHVAEEQGFFKEQGLEVTSEATDGSSFVVQQIAAGKSPVGIAVAEPVLLGYEQNQNFTSVYDFLTGNVFDLWVLSDSKVQAVGDLAKGDKIALKEQSGGEIPRLNAALEKEGLKPGTDIEYVYFGENSAVAADLMAKGKTQALMISWNSVVGVKQALKEEGKELRCVTCTAEQNLASESVIVNNEFLNDNREAVEKLGRAMAQATVFGATNPDAALAIMKKVNPEEQVDEAYAKAYFTAAVDITKPRQPTNKYGWHDLQAYDRSMQLLLTPGNPAGLAAPIDLDKAISNAYVDAYNNFDKAAVESAAKTATG
jgi:NitT/TauT family transport system substrate-binding protein